MLMIIDKILNNNVVIIQGEHGEQVVMGKGIGFKKKQGQLLDENLIEKVFLLKEDQLSTKLTELLSEIPLDIIITSEKIINYAKETLPSILHDSIYISLTDHIYFALERHEKNLNINNGLLWEIKKIYPEEYNVAKKALQIIHQSLNIDLPEDEAGFIAIHLINAQLNNSMNTVIDITRIMQEILHIVKYYFKLEYDEESISYYRFVTHLKFFGQRILTGNYIENNDTSLYDIVKEKYVNTFQCINNIDDYLQKIYQRPLTKEEMLYLAIHIERIKQTSNTNIAE